VCVAQITRRRHEYCLFYVEHSIQVLRVE
jgi:hypothetical protein